MYWLLAHVEMRPPRFKILSTKLWRVQILAKVLLCHAEVLVLQLLDPSFKSTIFVPELNQLGVYFIDGGDLRRDVQEGTSSTKFTIFCIAFLHDGLDLSRRLALMDAL